MTKKRPRTERRERERAAVKLAEARLKLARLEPGGSPERPIEVDSASVVEPHALAIGCAACGEATRLEEHGVVHVPGARSLRVARVRCSRCGARREIFFRLGTTLAS
jgi:hypothetical protein